MTLALHGICASKGIAIGRIYMADPGQLDVYEYTIWPRLMDKELARFERAVQLAREQLHIIKKQIPLDAAADVAAFIDTHLLMLDDAAICAGPVKIMRERRCNAEWALKLQRDAIVSVFESMDDPYLRTRRDDIDHVINRIQRILFDEDKGGQERGDGRLTGRVVFADEVTPADAVVMHHQGMSALVTQYGGANSHTAILARSLRIPAVVGLHHVRPYLRDDELVIVDGREGVVLVEPDERMLRHFRRRQRDMARYHALRRKLRRAPVVTADGEQILLQANVELPADITAASEVGAHGIGLYRTEYLFMNREQPPDENEQYEAYAHVVKLFAGNIVTIRTLDLGADKQVDGTRPGAPATSNPALGLRAVRLCLKEPGLFLPQLRAILRASAHGSVRIMIPMMSNLQELRLVLGMLSDCRKELDKRGEAYGHSVQVGAMIEVPAAAVCADLFAQQVDFLSIGTNDLIQYAIAIDRVDDEVNYLYDPLHPAVLRLIQNTIVAGQQYGIPVAMCGEMAGDARYTRLLLGMGLREFSVHPNAILEIKQVINQSDTGELKRQVQSLMRARKPAARTALAQQLTLGRSSSIGS